MELLSLQIADFRVAAFVINASQRKKQKREVLLVFFELKLFDRKNSRALCRYVKYRRITELERVK